MSANFAIEMLPMRARRSDPQTSKAAAIKSAEFAASHAGIIHLALIRCTDATGKELAGLTGFSNEQVCRRLPQLMDLGMARVKYVDGKPLTRDGARAWEAIR